MQFVGNEVVKGVAKSTGRRTIIISSYDRFGTKEENASVSNEFRQRVKRLPAGGQTDYLHGELYIVKGAKMHLTSNIATELGCANGSECEVVHVEFHEKEVIDYNSKGPIRLKYMPRYIRIRVPKLTRQIPGHGWNEVTIFPATTTLTINDPTLFEKIASQTKMRKGKTIVYGYMM